MNRIKLILIIFIALTFTLSALGVTFATPADTFAHPAYGFTPQPPPPPPPPDNGGGGGGGDTPGGGGGGTQPTHTVIVEIDRCDLSCSVEYVDTTDNEVLFASVGNVFLPTQNPAGALNSLPNVEVLIPVQLVHQGSGFIVEITLSDSQSTSTSVPYPGQWEVFMINPPQFVADGMMDLTGLNVAQLQSDLTNNPVSLGVVQANAGTQMVKCPIECIIEEEAPAYLPETGKDNTNTILLFAVGVLFFGILTFQVYRDYQKDS